MRKKGMLIAIACVAALALLAFAGCGSQQKSSSSAAQSSSSAPAYSLTIGDVKSGAGEFLLKNETQKGITEVKVKAAQDADFPADPLVMSTKTFSTGSVAQVYLPPLDAAGGASQAKAAFQFTCADGTVYTLHDVSVNEIKEASLCVEGDVAYLKYTNSQNNQEVNTFESEKAALAAAAVAVTAAPAEQTANNQSNQGNSDDQGSSDSNDSRGDSGDSGNSGDSGDSGSGPSNEAPAPVNDNAVGGGEEADCIEDPVLK